MHNQKDIMEVAAVPGEWEELMLSTIHPLVKVLISTIDAVTSTRGFAIEADAVLNSVPSRRAEFLAGRNLARAALRAIGREGCAIPRQMDRSPKWPPGVVGSISHAFGHVAVAVAEKRAISGLGIDIERSGSVSAELRQTVRSDLCDAQLDDTRVFSAKEAVFKAVYPLCGEFLEFKDLTIRSGPAPDSFVARARQGLASSLWLPMGAGRILEIDGQLLTLFWLSEAG